MPDPDRILRLTAVIDRTGLSRSTIYRKIVEGTFPPQQRISAKGAGWSENEINRWVANPPEYRAPTAKNEIRSRSNGVE